MSNIVIPAPSSWQKISQTGEIPSGMSLLKEDLEFKVVQSREITESKTGRKSMRLTGIVQKADSYNENGRIYSNKILTEAVEAIQPAVRARRVMGEFDHPCLISSDFRVLTVDGWKDFSDIAVGEKVLSLKDGRIVESRVNEIINEPYVGSAYHFKGNNIDSTFTGPHRMLLIERPDRGKLKEVYVGAREIYENRKSYSHSCIPRTGEWIGESPEFITIPGISESDLGTSKNRFKHNVTEDLKIDTKLFVSFLGIYLAEGNLASGHTVVINQFKTHTKNAIKNMLSEFPFEWNEDKRGFNVSDIRLYKYLEPLGDCYHKYVPLPIKQLDAPYLEELLNWFSIGDGRNVEYEANNGCKYNRRAVFSVSRRLVQDLHECLIKSGGCGNIQKIVTSDDYVFAGHLIEAKNKVPLWQLHIAKTKNIYLDQRFMDVTEHHHEGNIFCLSVDHGNFYMEQNNKAFWTGNCDAKIHMDRVSHLMVKVWMEGKNVLGELEVLEEMPCGQMLAALVRAGVAVGISSRGIGDMKPTMTESMQEAYEVLPGYRFVTWDTVAEPSVKEAELSVMESKQRIVTQKKKIEQDLLAEISKHFGA